MFLEDIQQIEEERDFYYSKLRNIEKLCQMKPGASVTKRKMVEILSATPEDFVLAGKQNRM
jgi:RP/EB family microtubule-associated protein